MDVYVDGSLGADADAARSNVGSKAPSVASAGLGLMPVQPWFPPGGTKLATEAWQRLGADSAAIRNATVWQFAPELPVSHHLRNHLNI